MNVNTHTLTHHPITVPPQHNLVPLKHTHTTGPRSTPRHADGKPKNRRASMGEATNDGKLNNACESCRHAISILKVILRYAHMAKLISFYHTYSLLHQTVTRTNTFAASSHLYRADTPISGRSTLAEPRYNRRHLLGRRDSIAKYNLSPQQGRATTHILVLVDNSNTPWEQLKSTRRQILSNTLETSTFPIAALCAPACHYQNERQWPTTTENSATAGPTSTSPPQYAPPLPPPPPPSSSATSNPTKTIEGYPPCHSHRAHHRPTTALPPPTHLALPIITLLITFIIVTHKTHESTAALRVAVSKLRKATTPRTCILALALLHIASQWTLLLVQTAARRLFLATTLALLPHIYVSFTQISTKIGKTQTQIAGIVALSSVHAATQLVPTVIQLVPTVKKLAPQIYPYTYATVLIPLTLDLLTPPVLTIMTLTAFLTTTLAIILSLTALHATTQITQTLIKIAQIAPHIYRYRHATAILPVALNLLPSSVITVMILITSLATTISLHPQIYHSLEVHTTRRIKTTRYYTALVALAIIQVALNMTRLSLPRKRARKYTAQRRKHYIQARLRKHRPGSTLNIPTRLLILTLLLSPTTTTDTTLPLRRKPNTPPFTRTADAHCRHAQAQNRTRGRAKYHIQTHTRILLYVVIILLCLPQARAMENSAKHTTTPPIAVAAASTLMALAASVSTANSPDSSPSSSPSSNSSSNPSPSTSSSSSSSASSSHSSSSNSSSSSSSSSSSRPSPSKNDNHDGESKHDGQNPRTTTPEKPTSRNHQKDSFTHTHTQRKTRTRPGADLSPHAQMIGDQVLMTNITNKHAKHDDHDGPCKDSFRTYLKNTAGTDLTKNNMLHDTLCNMYDAHIDATALIHLSDRGKAMTNTNAAEIERLVEQWTPPEVKEGEQRQYYQAFVCYDKTRDEVNTQNNDSSAASIFSSVSLVTPT